MELSFSQLLLLYYIAANAFALLLFYLDKRAAKARGWRVPERMLLAFCAAGGALGGWIGMLCFRHKTRRRKFTRFVPVFLLVHLVLIFWLYQAGCF